MLLIFQFFFEKKTILCADSNPVKLIETLNLSNDENLVSFTVTENTEITQKILNTKESKSERPDTFKFGSNNKVFQREYVEILYSNSIKRIKKEYEIIKKIQIDDKHSKELYRKQLNTFYSLIGFFSETDDFDKKNDDEKLNLY
ncbi:hypothetical protein GVAV_001733 [Gurleya vavrai]